MKRRHFIGLMAGLAAGSVRIVRAADRTARIGFLSSVPGPAAQNSFLACFVTELKTHGWIEGQNLVIDYRSNDGFNERNGALVDAMLKNAIDLILASNTPTLQAALKAPPTLPIVFATVDDPVAQGFVASLAHPGGRVTGVTAILSEIIGKHLELLQMFVPKGAQIGLLYDPGNAGHARQVQNALAAGHSLALTIKAIPVRIPEDLDGALMSVGTSRYTGLVVLPNAVTRSWTGRIVDFAVRHKLPTIYTDSTFAAAGGLMSYGANFCDIFRRAAALTDKILKGTPPADLPVETPTRFELVLNLKTAKAMKLTFPPTLLTVADEVIE